MSKKCIVIGAGVLGASAAYHLAESGCEVTVIDRNDDGQATDAAAGIICPWLTKRRNKGWYRLVKAGARYYPELISKLHADGQTETGYSRVGAIKIHTNEERLSEMKEHALTKREDAPEMGEITLLNQEETNALFPPLDPAYQALHISGAARVNGRALRNALLESAKSRGAQFIQGNASLIYQGTMITGVEVDGKALHADTVIAASGAWMHELIAPLGVQFRVRPQKAQIIHLQLPGAHVAQWPVVMPPSNQYLLTFSDRIIIGATHENHKGFDYRPTAGGINETLTRALEVAPGLEEASIMETRIGFRPVTPDSLPVLGKMPGYSGLLLANGLGASGLTMGPYIGAELAKMALGKETEIFPADYDISVALK